MRKAHIPSGKVDTAGVGIGALTPFVLEIDPVKNQRYRPNKGARYCLVNNRGSFTTFSDVPSATTSLPRTTHLRLSLPLRSLR